MLVSKAIQSFRERGDAETCLGDSEALNEM